jgi:putative flippase GtrA
MISRFVIVGCLGFVLQLLTLWALTSLGGLPWLPANAAAVEVAVLHNFVWHEWWTWGDRRFSGFGRFGGFSGFEGFGWEPSGRGELCESSEPREPSEPSEPSEPVFARLVRFNIAAGLTSIVGNLVVMEILVGALGFPPLIGNTIAGGLLSVVNFIVSDRWVFTPPSPAGFRLRPKGASARQVGEAGMTSRTGLGAAGLVALVVFLPVNATAGPSQETLRAWDAYVAQAEAQLDRAPRVVFRGGAYATEGGSTNVPGGTISDWRGAAFLPGITLDQLLHRLQHPGTPPPQEDVVSSRVVGRSADGLRVSIQLVRRSIVTVSYDTEHEMTFRRKTPTLATARSVATRIEEIGGDDHGFLWQLHSYWRYEERAGGVMVELQSLTLSRDVPSVLRPIASPLVRRVARESMVRTLEALRREYGRPS